MNDFWIKIAIGVIAGAFGFLFRIYFGHSKKINKTSERVTILEANDKNREKADIRVEKAIDKLTDILTENQKTTIDMYKLIFEKVK